MAAVVFKVERARWRRAVLVASGLLLLVSIQPSSSRGGWNNCFQDEMAALMDIKAELEDPNDVLQGWSLNGDLCPCLWEGVLCPSDDNNSHVTIDENSHVKILYLANQGLSGTLSPRIGDLTSLHEIILQGNAISGPIPETIGKLELLREFDVSNNSFNGSIPSSLGDPKNISQIILRGNAISGPIPDTIGKLELLREFDVSNNRLNGSIPSSLGDLKNLSKMKLNNNNLSGPVPDSFGALDATIDLSFNNLSGPLPNISSGTLDVTGNPLICHVNSGETYSHNQNSKAWPRHGTAISRRVSIVCAVAVSSIILVGILP